MKSGGLTVVEWHHMGDAVMALPFIQAARRAGTRVSACATPGPASVFALAFPDMEIGVFRAGTHAWWRGGEWSAWRKKTGADTAVCAWGDPRVHLWMKHAGYVRRLGLPAAPNNCYAREAVFLHPRLRATRFSGLALERCAGPLLTDAWSRPSRNLHHQENWRQLARMLGFSLEAGRVVPRMEARSPAPRPYWVLHPGGRLPIKRWDLERWRELSQRMADAGWQTVWVADPEAGSEKALIPGQSVFLPKHLCGFAELVEGAEGLVGLDSFAAHLSAAMEKNTVVLFGEMPDCWFAPRGPRVRLVQTPMAERRLRDYTARRVSLLRSVTSEAVMHAVLSLGAMTGR